MLVIYENDGSFPQDGRCVLQYGGCSLAHYRSGRSVSAKLNCGKFCLVILNGVKDLVYIYIYVFEMLHYIYIYVFEMLHYVPLDLRSERKYGWNVYFCCVKETGQPTVKVNHTRSRYTLYAVLDLAVNSQKAT